MKQEPIYLSLSHLLDWDLKELPGENLVNNTYWFLMGEKSGVRHAQPGYYRPLFEKIEYKGIGKMDGVKVEVTPRMAHEYMAKVSGLMPNDSERLSLITQNIHGMRYR